MRLDGMGALAVLSKPRKAKFPVMLLVAEADLEAAKRAVKIGVALLLQKPIAANALAKQLTDAAAQQRKAKDPGTYDVRLINAFSGALQEVLAFHFGAPPTLGKPQVKKGEAFPGVALTATMSFSGDKVMGSIGLGCEPGFLLALGRKIFGPELQAKDFSEQMQIDLAAESCNQVSGAAKTALTALGLKIMIGLPKVIAGAGHKVIHVLNNPVLWIPATAAGARCYMEFCMTRVAKEDIVEAGPVEGDAKGGDVLLF